MKEFKKLNRASSIVYDSNGNNGISVTWYNSDIKIYPVNYEDIIKDYAGMCSDIKMHAIKYVDEFFTSDQIKLLSHYNCLLIALTIYFLFFYKNSISSSLFLQSSHIYGYGPW